jgi:hypothetical protein
MDPWDVAAGEVMVLTASCWIDKQRDEAERLCLVAPLFTVESVAFAPPDLVMLRDYDCLHQYMYLPSEAGHPERVVSFIHAQPIRFTLLNKCEKLTQISHAANRQLMRKLTMFYSTAHVSATDFQPMSDDFPDGTD